MDNRIKVLMLGPAREVHGGISGVVNNLYEAGLGEREDIEYIPTMKEGSKIKKLLVAMKAYLSFVIKLSQYDIVHVNVASDSSFNRKSIFIKKAYKKHKKIVIHQHGGEWVEYYRTLSDKSKDYVKKIFNMGDEFLVLSPFYKDFFETTIGIKNIKIFPDTIKIPTEASKEYGQNKLLFLGRLCREKGVLELIEAVKKLHAEIGNIELDLGGIWENPELQSRIEGSEEYIHYLGWLDSELKHKALTEHDIFVLPSYFEGQSVSILEAMANSLAIVATDVGGIPMMIEDDVTGVLVQPKDTDSLEAGLRKVILNPEYAQRLGENARKRADEDYNIEDTINALDAIYKRLL